ncbi:hypothetical protein DFJ73DRAFT_506734 [Zopfochytrium polystomum]|nr:hypothetical protein DFJ73DRAFT_506734 [Zopfochytrium polystomum]
MTASASVAASMDPALAKENQRHKQKRLPPPKITESPRSKILKLPEIKAKTETDNEVADTFAGKGHNPFRMPSDVEIFDLREEERRLKQEAKEKLKTLSIYEKNLVKRKNFKDLLAEEEDDAQFYDKLRRRDSDKILINKQGRADRHFGKENLQDFIAKKREMFLVQYALGVKRQEMRKLEEIAQAEEQKLLEDEKALEEDAAKFDAFLKENDKNSVEAIKRAEMETKAKLEKIQEIKKVNVQIMSIRSDMSKNEDQLKDLQRYRHFLDKLTPKEFFEEQMKLRKEKEKEKKATGTADSAGSSPRRSKWKNSGRRPTRTARAARGDDDGDGEGPPGSAAAAANALEADGTPGTGGGGAGDAGDDDLWNDVEDPSLYFKSPQQLLDIFSELEENNLALIQNCQETEEALEEIKQKIVETEARMEKETQSLTQQIELLNAAIAREDEKSRMLEERSKMFTSGLVGAESQEEILEKLNHKVKEVYKKCIGDSDANLGTLQMLANIENKLEQLFETIEMMPVEKVEQAEKAKDKERRQNLREEKLEAERAKQEERVQRALERARAPVKKKTGKAVVFRSAPPQKKKFVAGESGKAKEDEDLEYYL